MKSWAARHPTKCVSLVQQLMNGHVSSREHVGQKTLAVHNLKLMLKASRAIQSFWRSIVSKDAAIYPLSGLDGLLDRRTE